MWYKGSPERILRLTSASISRLETETSKAGSLPAGSDFTQAGLSHSCDRPTSVSPRPRAHTISVPLASNETTRMFRIIPGGDYVLELRRTLIKSGLTKGTLMRLQYLAAFVACC